ncbi:hypothetical protein AXF42_Ash019269 [Apostasia shenzhenica]|uniref:Uncharacterized protein n=1 Tax=Apostasia shenzhenica TaxID=1088818 RepID=A0A2I0AR61_9ASPA|nr:hypothetical protein AXF42_Ash019269 [Apostasia shenzhenica]
MVRSNSCPPSFRVLDSSPLIFGGSSAAERRLALSGAAATVTGEDDALEQRRLRSPDSGCRLTAQAPSGPTAPAAF